MEKIIDKLQTLLINIGSKLIYAIIVLIVGLKLIKFLLKLLNKGKLFNKLDKNVKGFVLSFIKIICYIVLFMTVASLLGIPLTSMITILGSCGVAIGLALQGGLSNIAGGLIILFFKPFRVGDWVDANGTVGTVKNINLFYTLVEIADKRLVYIPNGALANSSTINYSVNDFIRLDVDFSCSYDNDVEKVKKTIYGVVEKDKRIQNTEEYPIFVRLTSHGDSSLVYSAKVWVKQSDYWNVKFDLLENVKKELDKNDISIPYPQLDVHIKK